MNIVHFDGEHVCITEYGIAFAYSPEQALRLAKDIKECANEALRNGYGKDWTPGLLPVESLAAG